MTLTDKQRAELNADLDRAHVRQREGGGGKRLSYVEGWWVISELNRILGPGAWSYRATVELVDDSQGADGKYTVTYLGRCVLTVGDCVIEDVGAGHGKDKSRGMALESASKEAATDALKRCAKSLGNRLGLALYDKEQTHVADAPAQPEPVSAETAILVDMLDAEPAKAKAIIKAQWSKMSAADRAAINAAIARQKAGA